MEIEQYWNDRIDSLIDSLINPPKELKGEKYESFVEFQVMDFVKEITEKEHIHKSHKIILIYSVFKGLPSVLPYLEGGDK